MQRTTIQFLLEGPIQSSRKFFLINFCVLSTVYNVFVQKCSLKHVQLVSGHIWLWKWEVDDSKSTHAFGFRGDWSFYHEIPSQCMRFT